MEKPLTLGDIKLWVMLQERAEEEAGEQSYCPECVRRLYIDTELQRMYCPHCSYYYPCEIEWRYKDENITVEEQHFTGTNPVGWVEE